MPSLGVTIPKSLLVLQLGIYLNPVLLGFYGGRMPQAWLIKSLAIGDQFKLQPLSYPGISGDGTESSTPLITSLFFLATSSHP